MSKNAKNLNQDFRGFLVLSWEYLTLAAFDVL